MVKYGWTSKVSNDHVYQTIRLNHIVVAFVSCVAVNLICVINLINCDADVAVNEVAAKGQWPRETSDRLFENPSLITEDYDQLLRDYEEAAKLDREAASHVKHHSARLEQLQSERKKWYQSKLLRKVLLNRRRHQKPNYPGDEAIANPEKSFMDSHPLHSDWMDTDDLSDYPNDRYRDNYHHERPSNQTEGIPHHPTQ